MKLPKPESGLVICYSYLWHHEAMRGQQEGVKDRPCAIILAHMNGRVLVAPITHTKPRSGVAGLEIPPQVKKQLGLDHERSWIITNDLNSFQWPGPDIRPATSTSWTFGRLSPGIMKTVLGHIRAHSQDRTLRRTGRDEESHEKLPSKDRRRDRNK